MSAATLQEIIKNRYQCNNSELVFLWRDQRNWKHHYNRLYMFFGGDLYARDVIGRAEVGRGALKGLTSHHVSVFLIEPYLKFALKLTAFPMNRSYFVLIVPRKTNRRGDSSVAAIRPWRVHYVDTRRRRPAGRSRAPDTTFREGGG